MARLPVALGLVAWFVVGWFVLAGQNSMSSAGFFRRRAGKLGARGRGRGRHWAICRWRRRRRSPRPSGTTRRLIMQWGASGVIVSTMRGTHWRRNSHLRGSRCAAPAPRWDWISWVMGTGRRCRRWGRLRVKDAGAEYPVVVDPFIEQAKLTASDGAAGDRFGYSVAISGDTVVVGTGFDDIGANANQGSAYVFVKPMSGDTDADAHGDTDADAHGDTDGDPHGDTDPGGHGDSDGDPHGDPHGDSDGDPHGDTDRHLPSNTAGRL
jgi:hypothetical protein